MGPVVSNQVSPLNISGVRILKYEKHKDGRGEFQEMYSKNTHGGMLPEIVQVNLSFSRCMTVRGLHVAPYSKLCTVIGGMVFDVIADVRKDSQTYGCWCGVWLDDIECNQILVPANCAHGFFVQEDGSYFLYQQDGLYDPNNEFAINWRDPTLNIKWPKADEYPEAYFNLSEKDRFAPFITALPDKILRS
jgi:dTDP-4-dehydrorhamnose 3,5-epimerase